MLFELVSLRNSLIDSYKTQGVEESIKRLQTDIENIKIQIQDLSAEDADYINKLRDQYQDILHKIDETKIGFSKRLENINERIAQVASVYAFDFTLEQQDPGPEAFLTRRKVEVSPETEDIIIQKLRNYTDWKYPSLEIGCLDGHWTKYMTAADPLYIMDRYQELMDLTSDQFADQYRKRLRKYLSNNFDFSKLPQEQFGFVFCGGRLNFVNVSTVARVLQGVKKLLRDGGVFMFSYNDGDTANGANLAEKHTRSFVQKSSLISLCENIGFEIIETGYADPNFSWVEIKKPGTLTTIKAHQVLGKITRKNN